jgi:hypothetical protein
MEDNHIAQTDTFTAIYRKGSAYVWWQLGDILVSQVQRHTSQRYEGYSNVKNYTRPTTGIQYKTIFIH